MEEKVLKEIFIKIFGEEAYKHEGKVSDSTIRLFKAIRYYDTQFKITKRWCDEEGKEHIDGVRKTAFRILSPEEVEPTDNTTNK